MGQLLKLISEHSTAINAITAAVTSLVAVVGIFLTCFSIWSTNEGNRIANEQFQYERAKIMRKKNVARQCSCPRGLIPM